jgi:hypothetical protein
MSLTAWKEPLEGPWVEPKRPTVEPLTPHKGRTDSLVPSDDTAPSAIKSAQSLQAIAIPALEPAVGVFEAASLHYAAQQTALSPPVSHKTDVDLTRLAGKVICCSDFLEEPHRIALHLSDGTRLVIKGETTRADSGGFLWQTLHNKEPELKANPSLRATFRRLPSHEADQHKALFNGGKRILGIRTELVRSEGLDIQVLHIQLEGMREGSIKCKAENGELYHVVVREEVDEEKD